MLRTAERHLKEACSLDPTNEVYTTALGQVTMKHSGDVEEVRLLFENWCQEDPENPSAHRRLAEHISDHFEGDEKEAAERLSRCALLDPSSVEVLEALGEAHGSGHIRGGVLLEVTANHIELTARGGGAENLNVVEPSVWKVFRVALSDADGRAALGEWSDIRVKWWTFMRDRIRSSGIKVTRSSASAAVNLVCREVKMSRRTYDEALQIVPSGTPDTGTAYSGKKVKREGPAANAKRVKRG